MEVEEIEELEWISKKNPFLDAKSQLKQISPKIFKFVFGKTVYFV